MAPLGCGLHTATNDELVALCTSPTCEILGGQCDGGRKVVKISDQAVIKFGIGVTEVEANNQRVARRLVDPDVIRVPLVYRSFTKGSLGYIVMEYVKGQVLAPLEDPDLIRRAARALAHFTEIPGCVPGPLGCGAPRGLLWPENEDLSFKTTQDIEKFFNSRLRGDTKLALGCYDLVLCHLDVAPQNILWLEDGSVCLLDWECAGFYPRLFEVCGQRIIFGKEGEFNRILLESMKCLSEEEETQAKLIMQAFSNGQRFYLSVIFGHVIRV